MDTLLAYGPMVLSGLGLTIALSLSSLTLAVLFGLMGVWAKLSRNLFLNALGGGYTALVRGIPDLVLMLIIYFGGQNLINSLGEVSGLWDYVEISPFAAGTFAIGLIFGAYMTETFRGGFLAIDKGEIEAGLACGMSSGTRLRLIVWPQIVPLVLPSFTNNWLVLLKTTALVSIIGLQDVMYNANQSGRSSQQPFLFLLLAFAIYLGLTILSDLGLRQIRNRYRLR
ncbi:ABC transporter permease subunit (plasmid) [Ensifer adhaerens]|uniref:ABC transporter permease n=1 Tax=Ensifer adhaerens TaxID=106592 RepID=UPI0023A9A8B2|nr:ABC transporter permease subunit [Ensifer adhaerens]WDZ81938.1 ABC transporter permease subunit [Ensifer adhaerens]